MMGISSETKNMEDIHMWNRIKKFLSFINDAIEGLWFNRNVVISSIVIVMSSLCLFGAYISFSSN